MFYGCAVNECVNGNDKRHRQSRENSAQMRLFTVAIYQRGRANDHDAASDKSQSNIATDCQLFAQKNRGPEHQQGRSRSARDGVYE